MSHDHPAMEDFYVPNIDLRQLKWDVRFLHQAREVASYSKDPSTKCGAVIVRPNMTKVSEGYNGFPRGCLDTREFYENRDLKYSRVIHAEVNSILNAETSVRGCIMYTWPGGYGPSCDRCTTCIIQSGIVRVVHLQIDTSKVQSFQDRWREAAERGLAMYKEAGVEVVHLPESVMEMDVSGKLS